MRLRGNDEAGYLTVQFLVAIGLSLVLFTALANLVVFQYARGVVRAALDEGARAGARTVTTAAAAAAACQDRATATRDGLISGRLAAGVELACTVEPQIVAARADVRLRSWLPLVPDWRFQEVAIAVREHLP